MARTSKLAFPIPRRNSKKDVCSGTDEASLVFYDSPRPTLNNGSKVQKLLGLPASEYQRSRQNEEKNARSLHTKTSFISVAVSGVSVESATSKVEGGHHPVREQKMKGMQRPARELQTRPSSPLLERRLIDASSNWDSSTDVTSSRLQNSGSSSTLRSYYDPLKIPLSISQQTSASSARDMALRKGYPSISSTLNHNLSEDYPTMTRQPGDHRAKNDHMYSKEEPPQLDLSILFPKPFISNGPLLSPHRVMDSPSTLSTISDGPQSTSPSRRKWFGLKSKRSKELRSGAFHTARPDSVMARRVQLASIVPPSRPKEGMQNWFDGLEEEDCTLSVQQAEPSEGLPRQAPQPSDPNRSTPAPDLNHGGNQNLFRDPNRHLSTCARILRFQQSSFPTQLERLPIHQGSQSSEVRSTRSNSIKRSQRSMKSRESLFSNANLQKQSILALSSSEDESEFEAELPIEASRQHIRESVAEAVISDVSIHSAEQVAFSRSGPVVTKKALLVSKSNPLPDPAISGDDTCPNVVSQPLSSSEASLGKDHGGSKLGTIQLDSEHDKVSGDTNVSLHQLQWPVSPSGDRPKPHVTGQRRRMMAVTEEEERLLEAIRLKATSTRSKNSVVCYSTTPEVEPKDGSVPWPKTADADPRTSIYEADMSSFPSPPSLASTKIYGRSFRADSTNSLSHNRAVASPDSLDTIICLTDHVSKPPLSPSIKFSPPDILPSPTISLPSVITPLSAAPSGDYFMYGSIDASSPPHSVPHDNRHVRHRNTGSGMSMLDERRQSAGYEKASSAVTERTAGR